MLILYNFCTAALRSHPIKKTFNVYTSPVLFLGPIDQGRNVKCFCEVPILDSGSRITNEWTPAEVESSATSANDVSPIND